MEVMNHNLGLIKYHKNQYENLHERYSTMELALQIKNKKYRMRLDFIAALFGIIGLWFPICYIALFVGILDGFMQGSRVHRYRKEFNSKYPYDSYLFNEKRKYLVQNLHDLEQEMKVQVSELEHLEHEVLKVEEPMQINNEHMVAECFKSSMTTEGLNFDSFSYETPKKMQKNKLRYRY